MIFVLMGAAFSAYAAKELFSSFSIDRKVKERVKGVFIGYSRHEVRTLRTGEILETASYMSYPQFEFVSKEGERIHTTEPKHHLFERFTPGQEIEVIITSDGNCRIGGFYSLYFLDLCILLIGLCFIFIPLLFWNVAAPALQGPEGERLAKAYSGWFQQIASSEIGPITVGTFLKIAGGVFFILLVAGVISAIVPYFRQMHLGFGYELMEALQIKNYDKARTLILERKGINQTNEYNQSPLIITLESDQFELARLLIDAGADVNVKSKMYKTPLLLAVHAGNLESVKLLLSKGASPDAPIDETPPVFFALANQRFDIARVLIESNCDLKRVYIDGEKQYTVGDFTMIAKNRELTDLVKSRGGAFTTSESGAPVLRVKYDGYKMLPFVETFTLDQAHPSRTFYGGKLRIELAATAAEKYCKTAAIRISSDSVRAEYRSDYQEYTFVEMTQGYVGSPLPKEPYKCREGWIYYEASSPGSVTLSLYNR